MRKGRYLVSWHCIIFHSSFFSTSHQTFLASWPFEPSLLKIHALQYQIAESRIVLTLTACGIKEHDKQRTCHMKCKKKAYNFAFLMLSSFKLRHFIANINNPNTIGNISNIFVYTFQYSRFHWHKGTHFKPDPEASHIEKTREKVGLLSSKPRLSTRTT